MAFYVEFKLDEDADGYPKSIRGGFYRGSLLVCEDDIAEPLCEITGFRIASDFSSVMPPVSATRYGAFPVCKLHFKFAARMLKALKQKYAPSEVS